MRWASLKMASLLPLLTLTSTAGDVVEKQRVLDLETERTDTAQMLRAEGYRVEEHFAVTEDGYVLRMFRVPPLKPEGGRPPVMLQHGMLSCSDDFVMNGRGRALAPLLADAGYDVWMGNGRGNIYSRNHILLDDKSSKFWKFSWHEQGVYDVPAMIDHILHVTGQRDLFYIGYSMGTTMFFVMMSEKPEYNKKIRAAFLMAPVAYMGNISSKFLKLISQFEGPLTALLALLGVDELEPTSDAIRALTNLGCRDQALTQELCSNIVFNTAGYNEKEINETMLPLYLAHVPAGASVRQLEHYGQQIKCGGHFRKYNFGPFENMKLYGRLVPPDYRLSRITAPVALHYGNMDCLAQREDVERLYKEIKNPIGMFRVDMDEWSHLDFVWGIHARELVYEKIFKQMVPFLHRPSNKTKKMRHRGKGTIFGRVKDFISRKN